MTWKDAEDLTILILVTQLGVDETECSLDAKITDDLGADSLDFVEIVKKVEEEFDLSISDDQAMSIITVKDLVEFIADIKGVEITDNIISFRVEKDERLSVSLQTSDGSWVFADGVQMLPSGIYTTVFNKYGGILKELEDMINYSNVKEKDLQSFFEQYPELIKGDDYDMIIPQAAIIGNDDCIWRADFVLRPFDQIGFCKILELKIPQVESFRKVKSGHPKFYYKLHESIRQLKDYSRSFRSEKTSKAFKNKYHVSVFEPDLHLIIGRKQSFKNIKYLQTLQKDNTMIIHDWDTTVDRLKRKFT